MATATSSSPSFTEQKHHLKAPNVRLQRALQQQQQQQSDAATPHDDPTATNAVGEGANETTVRYAA